MKIIVSIFLMSFGWLWSGEASVGSGENFGLGGENDYFIITWPKDDSHLGCFPQAYRKVSREGDRLKIEEIASSDRKPWVSDDMIGFVNNKKSGYCDKNGNILIQPKFDSILNSLRPFNSGLASVMVKDKYYYVDKSGNLIGGPYEWAYDFSDGVGSVRVNDKWGFVNSKGEWIVAPMFKRLTLVVGGYQAETDEGESGFINNKGEFIKNGTLGSYYKDKP